MAQKPPPGDDEVGLSEDQLEAMRRERAALVEISQADDEARRAEQELECQRARQRTLFYKLIREHSPLVRRLATRIIGDREADDVAQEAFVSFTTWLRRRSLEDGIELLQSPLKARALLCTMAARRAYDAHRRPGPVLTESGTEIEQTAKSRPIAPELGLELEQLAAAYEALPLLQRIAHILHYRYEFTDTELSATLGIPKSTCRTLVSRANRTLSRAMEAKP
jgi:RNA polymerase sigma factor (sigma-70 family)